MPRRQQKQRSRPAEVAPQPARTRPQSRPPDAQPVSKTIASVADYEINGLIGQALVNVGPSAASQLSALTKLVKSHPRVRAFTVHLGWGRVKLAELD